MLRERVVCGSIPLMKEDDAPGDPGVIFVPLVLRPFGGVFLKKS